MTRRNVQVQLSDKMSFQCRPLYLLQSILIVVPVGSPTTRTYRCNHFEEAREVLVRRYQGDRIWNPCNCLSNSRYLSGYRLEYTGMTRVVTRVPEANNMMYAMSPFAFNWLLLKPVTLVLIGYMHSHPRCGLYRIQLHHRDSWLGRKRLN